MPYLLKSEKKMPAAIAADLISTEPKYGHYFGLIDRNCKNLII